jgi:hypothetical protein
VLPEIEAIGNATGSGERLALGLSKHLERFALEQNAGTWKNFPNPAKWKTTMLEKLGDPNVKVLFNLEGDVDAWAGASRAARNIGGPTDWELLQIQQHPEWWSRIEWWNGGAPAVNPFQ